MASDVKWIKIAVGMFEDEKIDFISSLPDSAEIILIWVRLLTMAGRCNAGGFIMLTENIPYTDEMLASKFHKPLSIVRLALETFRRMGMIEQGVDGRLYVSNWNKYQSVEGMDKIREQARKRVAVFREKQKQLGFEKYGRTCQYCGGVATGVDHVIATTCGGTDDDTNKVACCRECNGIKNNRPLVDFLNYSRDRIKDELVTKNEVLRRHVTLSNVTGRYEVTQSSISNSYSPEVLDLGIQEEEAKDKKTAKTAKHQHGSQHNVLLTDDEMKRLEAEHGAPLVAEAIEFFSLYKAEKGYKSKSDNLAIRRWVLDAVREKKHGGKGPPLRVHGRATMLDMQEG